MILSYILTIVAPVEFAGKIVGGIIVLALVWKKIRPVVIVKSQNGGKFFFGISHSKKRKNMHPFTQDGVDGVEVDDDTVFGLANTPDKIIKEIGSVNSEKAQEMLNKTEEKKIKKIEKRKKGDSEPPEIS